MGSFFSSHESSGRITDGIRFWVLRNWESVHFLPGRTTWQTRIRRTSGKSGLGWTTWLPWFSRVLRWSRRTRYGRGRWTGGIWWHAWNTRNTRKKRKERQRWAFFIYCEMQKFSSEPGIQCVIIRKTITSYPLVVWWGIMLIWLERHGLPLKAGEYCSSDE